MRRNHEQQNNPNRIRHALVATTLLLGGTAVSACNVDQTNLPPETILVKSGSVDITAGEYDAIVDAAESWQIPPNRLGMLALCESGMSADADNGSHAGPFQQAKRYWSGRLTGYNNATGENLPNNIYDFKANANVSAKMIRDKGDSKHSKTHNGLPSDWVQCQAGWDGRNNKSNLWNIATLNAIRLQQSNNR